MACKVVAGLGFTGYGVYHGSRFAELWKHYGLREKAFNVSATGFVFFLAFLNFYAAYEIKMGKEMQPIEMRPSYSQRFREAYQLTHSPPNLDRMTEA